MSELELIDFIQKIAGLDKGFQAMALAVALADRLRLDGVSKVTMDGDGFRVAVTLTKQKNALHHKEQSSERAG